MRAQRGLTLISTLLLIVVTLSVGTVLARLLPTYMQHSKVVQVLKDVASEHDGPRDAASMRVAVFQRLKGLGITAVAPRDLKVSRGPKGVRLAVRYEVPVKLYGSLGLIARFEREVQGGAR